MLENLGYHATGLNEIVRESGAPKGSIYYYFPDGKEAIVSQAVEFAGQRTAERIRASLAEIDDPAAAVRALIEQIAHHVEASGFRAGGPLTIVASETATTSERINATCRAAYALLREGFAGKLREAGRSPEEAAALAWTVTAAVEGAIILSRTYHSGDPLRQAAAHLEQLIRGCAQAIHQEE
jgi:TetR/AcrR family transcriptional repressor of lmrAB and yxaGH operons